MSGASNYVQNLAIEKRQDRYLIPEWIRAIEEAMDYNLGEGMEGLQRKMDAYRMWCASGHGEEWFCPTDSEDEHHIELQSNIDRAPEMYDEDYTQSDEDRMMGNDSSQEAIDYDIETNNLIT